jgi:hypothetical protein
MKKIFIVLGGVLLTVPLFAQTSQNPNSSGTSQQNPQSTHSNTTPNQNNSIDQKQNLSDLAARMMNNTMQAKNAVENRDSQDALQYIGRASRDLSQLRGEQPDSKLVAIYSELTDAWVIGPVLNHQPANMSSQNQSSSSQQQNQNASNQTAHGQNMPAQQQSQNMNRSNSSNQSNQPGQQAQSNQGSMTPGVAVRDVRGRYTGVWLDTTADNAHLNAARDAIKAGNYQAADQALSAVQDSLIIETVSGDVPLLKARENLILAKDAAQRGDQAEEQAALRAVSNALAEYGQNNGRHANDAQQLGREISRSSSSNVSTDQINSWWNEVSGWSAPAPSAG